MPDMAYQLLTLSDERVQVRCAPGKSVHMTPNPNGTWTVDEDEQRRIFPNRGEALNCAREIGGETVVARKSDWPIWQSGGRVGRSAPHR